MKYIQNQPPIVPSIIREKGGSTPVSFAGYVRYLTENHAGFDANLKVLRASIRIQVAAEKLETQGYMAIEEPDYALLRQANEAPSNGYPGILGMRGDQQVLFSFGRDLLPFIDAIEGAADSPPVAEVAAE